VVGLGVHERHRNVWELERCNAELVVFRGRCSHGPPPRGARAREREFKLPWRYGGAPHHSRPHRPRAAPRHRPPPPDIRTSRLSADLGAHNVDFGGEHARDSASLGASDAWSRGAGGASDVWSRGPQTLFVIGRSESTLSS